jgi:hypothetical protein
LTENRLEEFLQVVATWLGSQLGPGGFALFLTAGFFAWRWIVRDKDDRDDRDQMALEANARSDAMLRLATSLDALSRNQDAIRVGLADLRNTLERVSFNESLEKLMASIDNALRNQEQLRQSSAELRNVLERILTRLEDRRRS